MVTAASFVKPAIFSLLGWIILPKLDITHYTAVQKTMRAGTFLEHLAQFIDLGYAN